MNQSTPHRPKYWWIWPDFYIEKDARDAAKFGVTACMFIAGATGLFSIIEYFSSSNDNISILVIGTVTVLVYSVLGYGILKMSRIAASIALVFFLIEAIYKVIDSGKVGMAPLLVWYLIQSNRAVYWFKEKSKEPRFETPKILACPHCGAEYNVKDYRQDASEWHCPQCAEVLAKE